MSSSLSASSSTSSSLSGRRRPQHQHGFSSAGRDTVGILRQTPPSAHQHGGSGQRLSYVTPTHQQQGHHSSSRGRQHQPTPLVLDPAAAHPPPPSSVASEGSESRRAKSGTVRKLLEAATTRRNDVLTTPLEHDDNNTSTNTTDTAAAFARTAPRAGFLSKFGTNIPEFKRRFFVLKPSTHLYYFLSPSDTSPRGCIDLEHCDVQEVSHLPDGRFRFKLVMEDDRQIVLEARSEEVGRQWIESLQVERLDYARNQTEEQKHITDECKTRILTLEKQLEEYKYIERDRDGSLEDAANWKSRFERLNEGLRLLTQHLRRPPSEENEPDDAADENQERTAEHDGAINVSESSPQSHSQSPSDEAAADVSTPATATPHRESSLLDAVSVDEQPIEEVDIPGTHFSALTNVCQQLRDNVRLASVEASTAVEDLHAANEKVDATKARMAKAEKHICKLWEENCEIRKSLKQIKKEKRILVREVKNLQAREETFHDAHTQDTAVASAQSSVTQEVPNGLASDEERLIDELEEHVMSSIRLHEQFLGVNAGLGNELIKSVQKIESGTYTEMSPAGKRLNQTSDSDLTKRIQNGAGQPAVESSFATSTETGTSGRVSPLRPQTLSLFDQDSDDEEDDDDASRTSSAVSSVRAEFGDAGSEQSSDRRPLPQSRPEPSVFGRLLEESESEVSVSLESNDEGKNERKHPLLRLDEPDDAVPPNLCASSTQSESSKSVVTDTGQATSRLSCPLADVVETRKIQQDVPEAREDGRVYHLTFYSRKIGLQFQKVPAVSSARGLLTEAMTADLPSHAIKATGAETTAAELQRIAAISSRVGSHHGHSKGSGKRRQEVLEVATPVDAVLVCGFHGFDDSANYTRPKLGARLVAFDGISVEVGKWTFDSVRKAIQARGRPLTLSFRNDFLTTKQRSILTKAVAEIQAAIPPPRPAMHYQRLPDEPVKSHETDQFVNEYAQRPSYEDDDDLSVSVASSARGGFGRSFSSVASSSYHTTTNYRSFSDAPSSSVISSTIGPLMSNLMTGISKTKKESEHDDGSDIPQYLRHDAKSLENTTYYNDFKSSLL